MLKVHKLIFTCNWVKDSSGSNSIICFSNAFNVNVTRELSFFSGFYVVVMQKKIMFQAVIRATLTTIVRAATVSNQMITKTIQTAP